MRSPDRSRVPGGLRRFVLLVAMEARELVASRSFWLLLIVTGALTGHAFLLSTGLYAEASGLGGGPAALSQGLSPLEGVVVPTLGAYDLAATLLFPFVVIRLFAASRHSGALTLLRQLPGSFAASMGAKSTALALAWMITGLPGLFALATWSMAGGHLHSMEVGNVVLGHFLRGLLTIGLGALAASFAASAASAAIVALTITLGTWALDYVAAAQGGLVKELAEFTPSAALRVFEYGELRLRTVIVLVALSVAGVALAAAWLREGDSIGRRLRAIGVIVLGTAALCAGAARLRASVDVSENRRNSFSTADEAALRDIRQPLRITAYLAPQDPRLADFERESLSKLERVMPELQVQFVSRGRTGLFERAEDHYGEIWYELEGRRAMARGVAPEVVLDVIFGLAGRADRARPAAPDYRGYPLLLRFDRAWLIFFVGWPLLVGAAWWFVRRPHDRVDAIASLPEG